MEDCERQIIIDMLEKCNWNQTEAAERFHVRFYAESENQTADHRDQEEDQG